MELSSEVSASDCFKLNDFQVSWLLVAFPFLLAAPPCFDTSFPCHHFFPFMVFHLASGVIVYLLRKVARL